MTVILIKEEDHGVIGCVETWKDAMPWLIREGWIGGYTEHINDKWEYVSVRKEFGNHWEEKLYAMSMDEALEFWEGCFCFTELEVWSAS